MVRHRGGIVNVKKITVHDQVQCNVRVNIYDDVSSFFYIVRTNKNETPNSRLEKTAFRPCVFRSEKKCIRKK